MKENDYSKTPSNSINFRLNDILRNQNPENKSIFTSFSEKLGNVNGSSTDDMKVHPKSQQSRRTLSALKGHFKTTSAIEVYQTRQGTTSHLETFNDVMMLMQTNFRMMRRLFMKKVLVIQPLTRND